MSYSPINLELYTWAFNGALAGMGNFNRQNTNSVAVDYSLNAQIADAWAQAFDQAIDYATTPDEVQVGQAFLASYGFWASRQPNTSGSAFTVATNPATWTTQCLAIVAQIDAAETWLSSIGITPSLWGEGETEPLPLPSAANETLTSLSAGGPLLDTTEWIPSGGYAITGFSITGGTSYEIGNTLTAPAFTASYNLTPTTSVEIVYSTPSTGPAGPKSLTTPYTSATITGTTFVKTTNAQTATFELEAFWGASEKTNTITVTWGLPFLSGVQPTGDVAATQGFLDTMRTQEGAQVHTALAGNYLVGASIGAGNISCFACETGLGVPTVIDLDNNLPISPSYVGTVSGYTNPYGQTISMDLYTFGGTGLGTINGWAVS